MIAIEIINVIVAFILVLLSLGNMLIIKRKTKEVPSMWLSLLIGFIFIFLSQIGSYFAVEYQQPAYLLQYYREVTTLVGMIFVLRGLLLYLKQTEES
jgi:uncharacterized membrane protein